MFLKCEYQGDYGIQTWTQWANGALVNMVTESKNVAGCLMCRKNYANIAVFMVACKDRNKVDTGEDRDEKLCKSFKFLKSFMFKTNKEAFSSMWSKKVSIYIVNVSGQYITLNLQTNFKRNP